ncbi:MAG: hypothetical protein EBV05_13595 [Cyanobacteria bacterium WB6_1B_304]|nr:hypothetical protein [Cyanobacteria bacterium WB6_1B_304]
MDCVLDEGPVAVVLESAVLERDVGGSNIDAGGGDHGFGGGGAIVLSMSSSALGPKISRYRG